MLSGFFLSADNAAGNFFAGIPGGLCVEVIRHGMDDDRPSEDVPDTESVCDKGAPRGFAICENGREITGVRRMFTSLGVKMSSRVRKWVFGSSGAGSSLVDVESEHTMSAFTGLIWNAIKGPGYENRISDIIKGNDPTQAVIFF